ncbi:MAG: hypothetical protein ACK5KL_06335 [Dysgonomonas sp.]
MTTESPYANVDGLIVADSITGVEFGNTFRVSSSSHDVKRRHAHNPHMMVLYIDFIFFNI